MAKIRLSTTKIRLAKKIDGFSHIWYNAGVVGSLGITIS
jgi:hypothetical protein